ncbi:MAG: hypothetical protein IPL84_03075 [Chitinophagaceae bacterium]|nr:hypothetical protein [Chitinophagaceae bacterium]
MKLRLFNLVLLTACFMSMAGCYNNKEELLYPNSFIPADCNTIPARFAADIFPLISAKCAISGCHDASAAGGAVFQNYLQISGRKDKIYTKVVVDKSMPASGTMTPEERNKIKCWIEGGALNN